VAESNTLEPKLRKLRDILSGYGSILVAYSGGVDSTLLLKVAVDTLGRDNVLGVTERSQLETERSFRIACDVARKLDLPLEVINTPGLEEKVAANPADRCYYCKKALFSHLKAIAASRGLAQVAEGSNTDDEGDFRPGLRAIAELDIRSPLREAGLAKRDIRALARALGLPNWDRPSEACLASRFPYGERITPEKLRQVAEAEDFLHELGVRQVRVRHHGPIARIEVAPEDMARLLEPERRETLVARFREIGFLYTTLDLQGYRTGSMNETLTTDARLSGVET